MEIKPFGSCEHFFEVTPEHRWIAWHPNPDFTGDCPKVFLLCANCRIQVVATWFNEFNKFQAGETADVLECSEGEGHRFLTFTQYTALSGELKDITDNTEEKT